MDEQDLIDADKIEDSDAAGVGSNAEIDRLKEENDRLMNNWKRAAADFENFKKRKQQESTELLEFAKEMAVVKLLPSLQSFEQILKYAPHDDKYKDWLTGLKVTIMQLEQTMEEMGIKKIPTLGAKFDHNLHEAVEETEDAEEGMVAKEIQPGFTLNGRVMIPAKVAVGKSAA
ncbi:MAG: nucleotide exchange factor GrpE [Acidobacteriaceae bacterium]